MKIRMNKWLASAVILAVAAGVGASTAQADPMLNFEILGSVDGGNTWSSTVNVSSSSTFTLGVFYYYAPLNTTNSNATGSSGKISSLTNGKDGLLGAQINLTNNDPNDLPVSYTNPQLLNNYNNGSGSSTGTASTSGITAVSPLLNGSVATDVPQNATVYSSSNINGAVELYSTTATLGTVNAGSSTTLSGAWYAATGTPNTANGSFKINGGKQTVNIYPSTETSGGGTDPYTTYLPLTLQSSPTPEPASLCFLGVAVVAMMRLHCGQYGGRCGGGSSPRTFGAVAKCRNA